VKVSEAMTSSPVAVPAETPVRDVLALLETMEIRHLPVVDERGVLLGLVSERDLHSFYAPRAELAGDWAEKARAKLDEPVSRIMTRRPSVVGDDTPLAAAIQVFLRDKVSAVPVVHNDKVVGIVSYVDLLRVLQTMLERTS
jgi:acetoin utilization protein AcuB